MFCSLATEEFTRVGVENTKYSLACARSHVLYPMANVMSFSEDV
jgi:hypothetical protein